MNDGRFDEGYVFLYEETSEEDLEFVARQLEHYSEETEFDATTEAKTDASLMDFYTRLLDETGLLETEPVDEKELDISDGARPGENSIETVSRYRFEDDSKVFAINSEPGLFLVGENYTVRDRVPAVRKTAYREFLTKEDDGIKASWF